MIKKSHIAVIQMTRIGDVVQTTQACRQLRLENPDIIISLVTRAKFAKGLEFLTRHTFDNIFYVDANSLISNEGSLDDACEKSFSLFSHINSSKIDLLINASFSKSSSYVASLIKAQNKFGLNRNSKNQLEINDQWSQFVYSNVMNGTLNPFNLVDIYKFTLGAKETNFYSSHSDVKKQIILHPFASQTKKAWKANQWVDLIYKVAKDNLEHSFIIVGSNDDQDNANKIINSPALNGFKSRISLHLGQSIESVYDKINESELVLCHDSMISHLAALNSVPTIVLSLGTVRPNETTPYQNNVINIAPKRKCFPCKVDEKCSLLPCHKDISHEAVATITGAILNGSMIDFEFLKTNITPFHIDSIDIKIANFENGFMKLDSLNSSQPMPKDVMTNFYRIIWSYFFKEIEVKDRLPQINEDVKASLFNTKEGVTYLFELLSFGMKYTNQIINDVEGIHVDRDELNNSIDKLNEIDNLLAVTKNTYPMLQPLIDYFHVAKANAHGRNTKEVCESNLLLFYSLNNMCKVIYDLIDSCISVENKEVDF